jgi:hypothetical protein
MVALRIREDLVVAMVSDAGSSNGYASGIVQ